MERKIICLLCILLSVFLYACEYELDETNFVQIEEPKDLDYKMQLGVSPNEKGEYVIKYGFLTYTSNFPEDIQGELQLYDKNQNEPVWRSGEIYFRYNYFNFYDSWNRPAPSEYTLKCIIASVRSNTGSLADLTGYEYLSKTLEWKVILQYNSAPRLNLRSERVNETTFKLVWDKPDSDYGEVDHYTVSRYWYGRYYTTIETFFNIMVDQGYDDRYSVKVDFKDSHLPSISEEIYIDNYYNN